MKGLLRSRAKRAARRQDNERVRERHRQVAPDLRRSPGHPDKPRLRAHQHDSKEEAEKSYREQKASAARFGYKVWFAQVIAPGAPYSSGWVSLDRREPYY